MVEEDGEGVAAKLDYMPSRHERAGLARRRNLGSFQNFGRQPDLTSSTLRVR